MLLPPRKGSNLTNNTFQTSRKKWFQKPEPLTFEIRNGVAINGNVSVFEPRIHPDGPCYECTMTPVDWEMIELRRSCNLLTREEMLSGKIPTTPTISSIIAGLQCQEAVKLLHGMETIAGKRFKIIGTTCHSYTNKLTPKEKCFSHKHKPPQKIVPLTLVFLTWLRTPSAGKVHSGLFYRRNLVITQQIYFSQLLNLQYIIPFGARGFEPPTSCSPKRKFQFCPLRLSDC